MNHDIIDINDFTVFEEESIHREPTMDCCKFDEPIIGCILQLRKCEAIFKIRTETQEIQPPGAWHFLYLLMAK